MRYVLTQERERDILQLKSFHRYVVSQAGSYLALLRDVNTGLQVLRGRREPFEKLLMGENRIVRSY